MPCSIQLKLNRGSRSLPDSNSSRLCRRGTSRSAQTSEPSPPNQLIIWEQLMDAATVLLTANTETVYALGHLDLKTDGPTVVEAPPKMLGFVNGCACSATLSTSASVGPDKGQGGKFLFCRRVSRGPCRERFFRIRVHPPLRSVLALRGFKVDGKTDQAVALMKQTKVYPLAKASNPPPMEYLNGSRQSDQHSTRPTHFTFFEMLAQLVNEEPAEIVSRRSNVSTCRPLASKKASPSARHRKTRRCSPTQRELVRRLRGLIASRRPIPTPFYKDRKWQYMRTTYRTTFTQGRCP